MTIICDDSDASDDEVEVLDHVEVEMFDVELGADVSKHLGKDTLKAPRFSRFALQQAGDIQAAVQKMRLVAAAKRSRVQRSWVASFSFTKRSLNNHSCEAFS